MYIENIRNIGYIKEDSSASLLLKVLDYDNQPFNLKSNDVVKVEILVGINEGRLFTKEPILHDEPGVLEFELDKNDNLILGANLVEIHIHMVDGTKYIAPSRGYFKLMVERNIDSLGEADVTKVTLDFFLDQVDERIAQIQGEIDLLHDTREYFETHLDETVDLAVDNKMTPFVDEVSAQLAQKANKDEVLNRSLNIYTFDYSNPKPLVLNDFSGYNQAYHPSVLYIPEGFAGYKYWMVQTPYPIGGLPYRDRWECPVVYKSNNGVEWITVADPLDDLTPEEVQNGDYMSDPHLVFREDTQTLEVWYRLTKKAGSELPTSIIRKTTTDGENWSEREEMIPPKLHTSSDFMRSPSILWDNVNKKYRAWYQNNSGLFYNTSTDGKNWDVQQALTLDIAHTTWHVDVNYFNNEYHLLSYSSNERNIVHYRSEDGINFKRNRVLLAVSEGNPLYNKGLYRACSLLDEFGKIRVYFTLEGTSLGSVKAGIGLMVGDDFNSLKLASNRVVTAFSQGGEDIYTLNKASFVYHQNGLDVESLINDLDNRLYLAEANSMGRMLVYDAFDRSNTPTTIPNTRILARTFKKGVIDSIRFKAVSDGKLYFKIFNRSAANDFSLASQKVFDIKKGHNVFRNVNLNIEAGQYIGFYSTGGAYYNPNDETGFSYFSFLNENVETPETRTYQFEYDLSFGWGLSIGYKKNEIYNDYGLVMDTDSTSTTLKVVNTPAGKDGIIKKVNYHSVNAGEVTFQIFDVIDNSTLKAVSEKTVTLPIAGINEFYLNMDIEKGQILGWQTDDAGIKTVSGYYVAPRYYTHNSKLALQQNTAVTLNNPINKIIFGVSWEIV